VSQGFILASFLAFYGALATAVVLGWVKGGRPERAGVALVVGMWVFQVSTHRFIRPMTFASLDPFSFAADLFVFIGFAWIGYYAKRYWPLCAAALQLLSLAGHFARGVEHSVDPWVYSLMKTTPTFLVYITLIIATLCHWSRMRRARRRTSFPS
jgi:hypothetical protein